MKNNGYKFGDFPVEIVYWLDHHYSEGPRWDTLEYELRQALRDAVICSVGFVIHEDEQQVVLVVEQRGDKEQDGPLFQKSQTILKATIVSRVRLAECLNQS